MSRARKSCGSCGGNPPQMTQGQPNPPVPMTPPAKPPVDITTEEKQELSRLQEGCYEALHRPMVVKVDRVDDDIWYICQECLDKWMKSHEHLEEIVTGFKR